MLLKLEIENFYSIKDRCELDFSIGETTPNDGRFVRLDALGIRVPKILAFFGANASGKTTVMRAISFMQNFIERSFELYNPDDRIAIFPFATALTEAKPISLAMEFVPIGFEPKNTIYRYELSITAKNSKSNFVSWEAVRVSQNGGKFKPLFERQGADTGSEIKADKEFQLPLRDPRREVRKNVSLISSLVQFSHEPSVRFRDFIKYSFITNIRIGKFAFKEDFVTSYIETHDYAMKELNRLIRLIDVGIERVELLEVDGKKTPVFVHTGLDGVRTLPYESQGTQNLFCLFPNLAYSLKSGCTAVLDEIDSDLHPALMAEMIRWFTSIEENPEDAQLIVSCQNPIVLNELEKEEVFFVEKDEAGASCINPLSGFKGIRRDMNLYRKYLGGEFGSLPNFG